MQVQATSGLVTGGIVDTFQQESSLLGKLDDNGLYRIDYDLLLRPASANYEVAVANILLLLTVNGSDLRADFLNTGRFRMDRPAGITFTRASGLAGDALLTTVPVPGTLLLLATGLAGLGLAARRGASPRPTA